MSIKESIKFKRCVGNLLLILALCPMASLLVTGITTKKPTIFGFRPMVVVTDSMVPTLPVHSVLIGVPVDAEDVEVGDIIAYGHKLWLPPIIHRVISITDEGDFIFQGDNNENPDEPVKPEQIMYRIVYPALK